MDTYTAYFDKKFVRNFWIGNKDLIKDFHDNFMKELAEESIIYTNYDSIDEMRGRTISKGLSKSDKIGVEGEEVFWESLIDTPSKIKFLHEEKSDSNDDAVIQQNWISKCAYGGGYNIFFVEYSPKKCDEMSAEFGYLFISSNNFNQIWEKLALFGSGTIIKSLIRSASSEDDSVFKGWQDLEFIGEIPNNTIIITDQYLLSDATNQKIDKNLIPLLKSIRPKSFTGELDIFMLYKTEGFTGRKTDEAFKEHIKKVYTKIKRCFKDCSYKNVNPVFINAIKDYGSVKQHGRYIFTNYFTIWSDPGYNLIMDKGDRVQYDSQVEIYFFNSKHNIKRGLFLDILKNLREFAIEIKNNQRIQIFRYYPDHNNCNLRCKLLKLNI